MSDATRAALAAIGVGAARPRTPGDDACATAPCTPDIVYPAPHRGVRVPLAGRGGVWLR